jgi:hypothetical protein
MRTRTPRTLECVTILLEAGATPGALSFNSLCELSLGRYAHINLRSLHDKLLKKLCVDQVRPLHLQTDITHDVNR